MQTLLASREEFPYTVLSKNKLRKFELHSLTELK